MLLCAWFLRSPLHQMPLERDEGAYAVIAVRWLAGDIPYRDMFDHKPPAIYLVYTLAEFFSGDPVSSIRTLASFYMLAGALALLILGSRLYGRWGGLAAMVCFLVYGSSLRFQGVTFNSEAVMTLPAVLACLFVVWGLQTQRLLWFGVSGILVGVAALSKPIGVLLVPAFGLALLVGCPWPRWLAGLGLFLVGMFLAALPFGVYFWANAALPATWEALVGYNFFYVQQSTQDIDWYQLQQMWQSMLVLAISGLAGLIISFTQRAWRTSAHIATMLWGGVLFASALISLRPYPHYYLAAVPAFSLWIGGGVVVLHRVLPQFLPHAVRMLMVLALLVGLAVPIIREVWPVRAMTPSDQSITLYKDDGVRHFAPSTDVANYLLEHAPTDQPIFVWAAEPQIYYLADRAPATRFIYDYPINVLPDAQEEVVSTLEQHPPSFVITYAGVQPMGIDRLFRAHPYELLMNIGGFDIYERQQAL